MLYRVAIERIALKRTKSLLLKSVFFNVHFYDRIKNQTGFASKV